MSDLTCDRVGIGRSFAHCRLRWTPHRDFALIPSIQSTRTWPHRRSPPHSMYRVIEAFLDAFPVLSSFFQGPILHHRLLWARSLVSATCRIDTQCSDSQHHVGRMEKFSQYRDRGMCPILLEACMSETDGITGSGIAPFLPIPTEASGIALPFHIFLCTIRVPLLLSVTLCYFLFLQWLPIGPLGRKAALWVILGVPGIWWVDLQIDGVRKGYASRND
jgi:hypothetical protein